MTRNTKHCDNILIEKKKNERVKTLSFIVKTLSYVLEK